MRLIAAIGATALSICLVTIVLSISRNDSSPPPGYGDAERVSATSGAPEKQRVQPGSVRTEHAADEIETSRGARRDLAELRRLSRKSTWDGDAERVVARIMAAAHRDPARVEEILLHWKRRPQARVGEVLAYALSQIDDPRIAAAALAEVEQGREQARRLAGLALLDRIDSTDPEVLRALARIIESDADPAVVAGAIFGLANVSEDLATRREVSTALQEAASYPDAEVRRRALIALADWAQAPAQLASITAGLDDASPEVRAAAAFALGQSSNESQTVLDRLAEVVSDAAEDLDVRTFARNAIAKSDRYRDLVELFDREHEGLVSAPPLRDLHEAEVG